MKCKILHETTGRLRVHLCCGRMTVSQADVLEYYLRAQDGVQAVKVYDRTQDAVVLYEAERGSIIRALAAFSFAKAEAMELVPEHTSRQLNREYEDKLVFTVCRRAFSRLFLPYPITTAIALSLSANSGGIPALTSVVVIVVGVFGGIVGPWVLRKVGVESRIAKGLAMGAAAHAMGTARAMELGAVEGAISGLAIGLMGVATAVLVPILEKII